MTLGGIRVAVVAWVVAGVAALVVGGAALGQSPLAASSDSGHLWFAIPAGEAATIWHVPARAGGPGGGGSASGTVRFAYALEGAPVGLAADGDRVAMFFSRADGGFLVRGLSVVRGRAGWQNASVGRLDAMAGVGGVAGGGELIGTAWNELGLMVLARGEGGELLLMRLEGDAWREVELGRVGEAARSDGGAEVDGILGIQGIIELGRDAVGLLGEEDGERFVLRGDVDEDEPGGEVWRWTRQGLAGASELGGLVLVGGDGELIGVSLNEGGGGAVWRVGGGGVWRVGALAEWCDGGVGMLRGDDRIVAMGASAEEASAGGGAPRIFEMSVLSGRVFADGEAEVLAPVIGRDLRILVGSVLAVVFMVIAMVGVRMPPPPKIPQGWIVAPGLARVLATAGDLMVAALAVSAVTGESLMRVLWLEAGMGVGGAINLGMVLATAFVHTTVFEGLFGASAGKLMVGCRVIGAEDGRVGFGRIAVRNAMKWFLLPSVLMAWVDPFGRHAGDALGRTVVVMGPIEES